MLNSSCKEFLTALSSGAPVPGGGGASAFCGALSIALGGMVCNLTLGKKKYADVQEDIRRMVDEAELLRHEFEDLVEADAKAFEPLSKAYGMPKNTEEELAQRTRVMEKCLQDACDVPLDIMDCCARAIALLEELSLKGSKIALSDVGVGSAFARAAMEGASMNVYINTALMKDRAFAERCESRSDELLTEWLPRADAVTASVKSSIRK
ncbi:cyclodeaminase/cyclohydrolase family protein [Acidaminobacterium chupaoyuni]